MGGMKGQHILNYCPVGTAGPVGAGAEAGALFSTSSTIETGWLPAPAIIASPIDVAKNIAARIAVVRVNKLAVPLAVIKPPPEEPPMPSLSEKPGLSRPSGIEQQRVFLMKTGILRPYCVRQHVTILNFRYKSTKNRRFQQVGKKGTKLS